mgnify:FL=1
MRYYILKVLIAIFALYLLFKLTIGTVLNSFNSKIEKITNQSNRIEIKEKILLEMKKGSQKENLFTKEEKIIISNFMKKVIKELNLNSIE